MAPHQLCLVVDNTQRATRPGAGQQHNKAGLSSPAEKIAACLEALHLSPEKSPIEQSTYLLDPAEIFPFSPSGELSFYENRSATISARGLDDHPAELNRLTCEVRVRDHVMRGLTTQQKLEITAEVSRALHFGSVTWDSPGYKTKGYLTYRLCSPLDAQQAITSSKVAWLLKVTRTEVPSLLSKIGYIADSLNGH